MPKTKTKQPSKIHRSLHLQHHHHTGKMLHHRHTSYRSLAIILVIAGAFIVGVNILGRATADDLVVYARNPAPIPTTPAVITKPTQGENVSKSTVIIEGTCPNITPHVVIALLNDGTQIASLPCDNNNAFNTSIVVEPGLHTLIARTYTITGDNGPDSKPVTFSYTTPAPVTSATTTTGAEEQHGNPLSVSSDTPFITFGPAKDAIWSGNITGGTAPYRVRIDWGDGSSNNYTVTKGGEQAFTHHYISMEPHSISIRVTDTEGRGIARQYAAVTPYVPPVANSTAPLNPRLPFRGSWPLGIYGLYLLLLTLFGLLWIWLRRDFAFATVHITPSHVRSDGLLLVGGKRRSKDKKTKKIK